MYLPLNKPLYAINSVLFFSCSKIYLLVSINSCHVFGISFPCLSSNSILQYKPLYDNVIGYKKYKMKIILQ